MGDPDGSRKGTDTAGRRGGLSPRSMAWIGVTALFALLGGLSLVSAPEPDPKGRAGPPGFDLQGHRGARGLMPENSLPAIETALAIGVTTLELDTVLTRDAVPVLYHDRRLDPDRTRRAGAFLDPEATPAALLALDGAALAAYDIGRLRPESAVALRFPAQRGLDGVAIPTLAAALARAEALSGGRIRYNVETKISPLEPETSAAPEAFAEALVAVLRAAGVEARTTVQSFDWRSLVAVQEIAPEIATAYLTVEQDWLDSVERGREGGSPWLAGFDVDAHEGSLPGTIRAAGGAIWSPFFRDLRPADLAEAHRHGLRVVVWTVNEPADMASLIALGVDGIITDYPDRLRAVMAKRGLPLPERFPGEATD